jgi:hypothetical protein
MVLAYLAVALFAALAAYLDSTVDLKVVIGADFVVFAVFYVVAQATERLVEPLIGKVEAAEVKSKKAAAKEATRKLQASLTAEQPEAGVAADASAAQEALAEVQGKRAVIAWAMASCFALFVCGLLGLGLIEAVADVTGDPDDVSLFRRVDVIVTGLAIGAGTKPLHDLISKLEKAKQNADPAT